MLLKYNNLRFATLKYRVPLFYFFLLRPRRFSSSFALLPLHIKPRRIDLRFVTFLAPFYGRGMLLKFIRLFATSLSLSRSLFTLKFVFVQGAAGGSASDGNSINRVFIGRTRESVRIAAAEEYLPPGNLSIGKTRTKGLNSELRLRGRNVCAQTLACLVAG